MKTGKKGIDLIKMFEKCRLEAYTCPAGKWTIGYGHTGKVDGEPIVEGMKITKGKAIILLKYDLERFESAINKYVKVSVTQNQFDALISFSFNVGDGNFIKSTLLKNLNQKDYQGAANELLKWNKGKVNGKKVVLRGLTKRRRAEFDLFCLK